MSKKSLPYIIIAAVVAIILGVLGLRDKNGDVIIPDKPEIAKSDTVPVVRTDSVGVKTVSTVVALVDMPKKESAAQKRGDIICVKLEDAPWGIHEVKVFLRIKLDDSELRQSLENSKEKVPVIIYPYRKTASRVVEGETDDVTVNRSIYRFDEGYLSDTLASKFGTTLAKLQDYKTAKPILSKDEETPFGKDDLVYDDSERE